MNSRKMVWISMFAALGAGLRIAKHLIIGPIQFINFPYIVSSLSLLNGLSLYSSFLIGAFSFLASDMLLGAGPWTITNSISILVSLTLLLPFRKVVDRIILGVVLYLSIFIYDILSSLLGYLTFLGASNLNLAFYLSLVGLFFPVGGGSLFMVGPITEIVTVAVVILVLKPFKKFEEVMSIGRV